MTWNARYRDAAVRRRVQLDERAPYLSVLLSHPPSLAGAAERRARNFAMARREEAERPEIVRARPYHLVLDPASACNLRCSLCVQATHADGRRRVLASRQLLQRAVDQVGPQAIRMDLFNWGEPLLHSQLPWIAARAAATGLYTRTSSNLSLHLSPAQLEALIDSGLRCLVVSIDGASQEVYAHYRRRGRLALVLDNLSALVRARDSRGQTWPTIEWQFLALRDNVHEVEAAAGLAAQIGVDVFRYGGARGLMATKVTESVRDNFASSRQVLLDGDHPLSEYHSDGSKRTPTEAEGCKWLWGKLAVQADGGVSPCWSAWFDRFDHGNLEEQDLADLWNNDAFREARRTACGPGDASGSTACATCAYHRAFVNPPDRPEDRVGVQQLDEVAVAMRSAGLKLNDMVWDSVRRGLFAGGVADG